MSRWLPEPTRRELVGIDLRSAAWRPSEHERPRVVPLEDMPTLLEGRTGRSIHCIAALELCVHWMQVPPEGVASLKELRAVAAARCAQLHGGAAADWLVAADWSATRPFPCTAIAMPPLAAFLAHCVRERVNVSWATAWGATCEQAGRSFGDGWWALRSPSRVVHWQCRHGRVSDIGDVNVAASAADAEVESQLQGRMRLAKVRGTPVAQTPLRWVPASREHAASGAEHALACAGSPT